MLTASHNREKLSANTVPVGSLATNIPHSGDILTLNIDVQCLRTRYNGLPACLLLVNTKVSYFNADSNMALGLIDTSVMCLSRLSCLKYFTLLLLRVKMSASAIGNLFSAHQLT